MLYLDADVFFFIGHGKKGLYTDFLVHVAGPENLMIIFFFFLALTNCVMLHHFIRIQAEFYCLSHEKHREK